MPAYDFRCKKCQYRFERTQGMNAPNPACPNLPGEQESATCEVPYPCGGETEKLITGGTFHLKGGGWAADNYGSSK